MKINSAENSVKITTNHTVEYNGKLYSREEIYLSDASKVLSHTINWVRLEDDETIEYFVGQSSQAMSNYGWVVDGNSVSTNPTPEIELEHQKSLASL